MDMKRIQMDLASVLTTLVETHPEGQMCPASMVYLGLGSDMERWNLVKSVCVKAGFLNCTNETVSLTPKGKELGLKINQVLK